MMGSIAARAAVGGITEYPAPANEHPRAVALGPDGNVWVAGDGKVAKVTTSGAFTEYALPSGSISYGITAGSDGNLWLTEYTGKVAKVTTAGVVTEYSVPASNPTAITAGPDGNLWFLEAETHANKVAKLTPAGVLTEYAVPTSPGLGNPQGNLWGITLGPDGNIWFTETTADKIAKVTTQGVFTEYPVPSGGPPVGITTGPDGNLWFTEPPKTVGVVTPSGVFTEYTTPTAASNPSHIAQGPDGNLWFTEQDANRITSVTTAGVFTEYPVPTAASSPEGIALGNDGNVWFTEPIGNQVAKIQATALAAPGAPTAVTAVAGVGSATVTWTAPGSVGGGSLTGYTISSSGGATVTASPTVTQAVIAGLSSSPHTFTVRAINADGTGAASTPSNSVTPLPGGNYGPLVPARILDTRYGVGMPTPTGPLGSGQSLELQVTGQGGVPNMGVSSVVLNVTVTGTTAASFLSVWPQGGSRPLVSNLNWVPGKTVANLVEVAVNPMTGRVSIFNSGGSTHVIVDVQGYVGDSTDSFTRAGLFNPLPPLRDLDTRYGIGAPPARVGPGQTLNMAVLNRNGVPAMGVSAVILNVTAVGPSADGFLTVWPTGAPSRPLASNLNFLAGQVVPNRVMVEVGGGGQVSIYNPSGSVDIVADIDGWFTDGISTAGGTAFVGVPPTRIFDTRDPGNHALGPGAILSLGAVFATPHSALVLNVTAVTPSAPGFLTLFPDNGSFSGTPPTASDLNFVPGEVVPNLTPVKLGPNGYFDTYNPAGSTDVVYDEDGYYGDFAVAPPMVAVRASQTTHDAPGSSSPQGQRLKSTPP